MTITHCKNTICNSFFTVFCRQKSVFLHKNTKKFLVLIKATSKNPTFWEILSWNKRTFALSTSSMLLSLERDNTESLSFACLSGYIVLILCLFFYLLFTAILFCQNNLGGCRMMFVGVFIIDTQRYYETCRWCVSTHLRFIYPLYFCRHRI